MPNGAGLNIGLPSTFGGRLSAETRIDMEMKTIIVWSTINILAAPLVGVGLADSGLPFLVSVYIILVFAMAPIAVIAWKTLKEGN
jgi:hypothetical protein